MKLFKRKVELGELEETKLLELKGIVAKRKAELKKLKSELFSAKYRVLSLLNVDVKDFDKFKIELKDEPFKDEHMYEAKRYYELALKNWPKLKVAYKKIEEENLNVELTKNSTLPKLDLVFSASSSTLNDEMVKDIYDEDYLSWGIGLRFSMPIFNTKSESMLSVAKLKRDQAKIELKKIEDRLYIAILQKTKDVELSKKEAISYKKGLEFKEMIHSRLKRSFELGEGNLKELLYQQEELLKFKKEMLKSIVNWKVSQAILERAAGILKKKYL